MSLTLVPEFVGPASVTRAPPSAGPSRPRGPPASSPLSRTHLEPPARPAEATQAAYQAIRHSGTPTPLIARGGAPLRGPDPGWQAGHQASIGCHAWFGGPPGVHRPDTPPHALKLGPCFIAPPQGVLTEESAVPPP